MADPVQNNQGDRYRYTYRFTNSRQQMPSKETIYDQNPVNAFYGLLGWNDVPTLGIRDLSSDDHLGGQEVNTFLKNIHFDERNIDSRYGKGTLNKWKDTFKNWVNNRISGNTKYSDSQMAADREVLKDFMDEVNRQNVKYDPLTGDALYYGDSGYNQGVSDSDWQAANSQYTTARENYAKSLIASKYNDYLKQKLNDDTWKNNSTYGWNGTEGLTKANVYRLIQRAQKENGLVLGSGKTLANYENTDLNNFKFGDKSKAAFGEALEYYKSHNPALYNAIIKDKNFQNFIGNENYTEIKDLDPKQKGLGEWWNTTGKIDPRLVNEIDEKANNTQEVRDYLEAQQRAQQRQNIPAKFTSANLTLFKQGGKMNKYQQGGQAPTAAQMVLQALSAAQQGDQSGLQQLFSDKKTAQAVIQQLQKEAQEGSEEAIQALEALKQIMSRSKKQATMAQKGAKLSYIHRLATGCPPGMEMTYFKKGGRLCKACIEKAKKAKEGASLDNIIAKNKKRYPGITDDQAAGRAPIRKNGKDYYLGGNGVLSEAPKRSKYGFGGFFEYFKSGGKNPVKRVSKEITDDGYEMKFSDGTSSNYGRNPMNGKSVAIGRDGKTYTGEKADSVLRTDSQKTVPAIKANKKKSMACGGKAKKSKCGTKAKCGAELKKCGGKTTLAKCGAELEKCGGKAKKISSKKPTVNKDRCGGKAKKHAIGGNLELLKYMILNYNK